MMRASKPEHLCTDAEQQWGWQQRQLRERAHTKAALRFMSGFSDRGDGVIRMAQELLPWGRE